MSGLYPLAQNDAQYLENSVFAGAKEARKFFSKTWTYFSDSTNGVSNGQIQYNTTNLSGGGYCLWSESFFQIPTTTVQAAGTLTQINPFIACIKGWYGSLVDQVQVQMNGTQLINNNSFANVLGYLRMKGGWNDTQLVTLGTAYGFALDDVQNFNISGAGAAYFATDYIYGAQSTPALSNYATTSQYLGASGYNTGFYRRALTHSAVYGTSLATYKATTYRNNFLLYGNAATLTTAAATNQNLYYDNCIIPVKYLIPCMACFNFPLRGAQFLITLYMNQVSATTSTSTGCSVATMTSGNTNPLMVAAGASNSTGGVCSNVGLTFATTRMYVPQCVLFAQEEAQYISNFGSRVIEYDDYNYYTLLNQSVGAGVNWQITQGLSNVKGLIIQGFTNSASTLNTIKPALSCCSLAPYESDPYFRLDNIQIYLNGSSLYPNATIQYDYDFYLENMKMLFELENNETSVASGLWTKDGWATAPTYIFDVGRLSSNLGNPTSQISMSLQCTMSALTSTDLVAFVIVRKAITITANATGLQSVNIGNVV